jgi:hypothetical protein
MIPYLFVSFRAHPPPPSIGNRVSLLPIRKRRDRVSEEVLHQGGEVSGFGVQCSSGSVALEAWIMKDERFNITGKRVKRYVDAW